MLHVKNSEENRFSAAALRAHTAALEARKRFGNGTMESAKNLDNSKDSVFLQISSVPSRPFTPPSFLSKTQSSPHSSPPLGARRGPSTTFENRNSLSLREFRSNFVPSEGQNSPRIEHALQTLRIEIERDLVQNGLRQESNAVTDAIFQARAAAQIAGRPFTSSWENGGRHGNSRVSPKSSPIRGSILGLQSFSENSAAVLESSIGRFETAISPASPTIFSWKTNTSAGIVAPTPSLDGPFAGRRSSKGSVRQKSPNLSWADEYGKKLEDIAGRSDSDDDEYFHSARTIAQLAPSPPTYARLSISSPTNARSEFSASPLTKATQGIQPYSDASPQRRVREYRTILPDPDNFEANNNPGRMNAVMSPRALQDRLLYVLVPPERVGNSAGVWVPPRILPPPRYS